VKIATDERFVICYNPEQAERDLALREVMVGKLTTMIAGTDTLSVTKRAELRGRISTMPGLNRFLRVTPGGLLRVHKRKITAETTTGHTWTNLREELQELHVGTFEGPAGTFRQRTELTTEQRNPGQARHRTTQEDHRARATHHLLTSTNPTAWTHDSQATFTR